MSYLLVVPIVMVVPVAVHGLPLLLAAVGAASEEDKDHAKEETDEGGEKSPDCNTEPCMTTRVIIDVMA